MLGLVSLMVLLRLASGGESAGRIASLVGELWLTVGAWVVLFWWASVAMQAPAGEGSMGELRHVAGRLAGLPAPAQVALGAGVAVCAGLAVHLMAKLSRLTRGLDGC